MKVELWQPIDNGEDGRAYRIPEYAFTNERDALEISTPWNYGQGVARAIQVFQSLAEYHAWEADGVRRRALAKLTSEEKRALGL